MSVYEYRHTGSPQEAADWTPRQILLTDLRAVGGRAYPRVSGLFREKSWLFFEILLPFLSTSAFVFVYRALEAPPQYIGFVVLGGAMTAFWLNVIWMMAQQLWWEKSQGNLELYFAAPCSGRVLHTLNIRLFPEQLTYIANHAEDEIVFIDRTLAALVWPLLPTFETVKLICSLVKDAGETATITDLSTFAARGKTTAEK